MMAGNPNWWSMHPPSPFPLYALGSSSLPLNPLEDNHEPPQSWSQLLLGGFPAGEEDRLAPSHFQPKKLENWEDQILIPSPRVPLPDAIKQEVSQNSSLYGHGDEEFQAPRSAWSQVMTVSSPQSCVTSFSTTNNLFDFRPYDKLNIAANQHADHSSEVRKEKLGDRITALHQLVSPFGKTDTASVLLEAIGYIRFLLGQIEALSSPYMGNAAKNMIRNQQCVQGERSLFPEDPGQLLNDSCLKRTGAANQDTQDKPKDLGSRGLCLVPVSCTQHVGNDNGADYWAPAYGGGF